MLKQKTSAVIDYPRVSLDPKIWKNVDNPVLQSKIEDQILDIVHSFLDDLDLPQEALVGLFIYGSILTNQWKNNTDIDCRIVLSPEITKEIYPDMTGDDLFDLAVEKIHNVKLQGTEHILSCSVVIEGEETVLGESPLGKTDFDPVYDMMTKRIVKAPVIEEESFDPDKTFESDKEDTEEIMQKLDSLLLKTKIDTLDYDTIKEAIGEVSNPKNLMSKLEEKLINIESDIEKLVGEYDDIKFERTEAFSTDPQEDWRKSRHWAPGNVREKFLERYGYMTILKQLKILFKDGIDDSDVKEVEEILSVATYKGKSMKHIQKVIKHLAQVQPGPPVSPDKNVDSISQAGPMCSCGWEVDSTNKTGMCPKCGAKIKADQFLTINTAPDEQFLTSGKSKKASIPQNYEEYKELIKQRSDIISQNKSLRFRRLPTLPVPEKPELPKVVQLYDKDNMYIGTFPVGVTEEEAIMEATDAGENPDPKKTKYVDASEVTWKTAIKSNKNITRWKHLAQVIEMTDRYDALGIDHPDPKTVCNGPCEGTGIIPVYMEEFDSPNSQVRPASEKDEKLIALFLKEEEKIPTDNGYHFVTCPDCSGSGKRN